MATRHPTHVGRLTWRRRGLTLAAAAGPSTSRNPLCSTTDKWGQNAVIASLTPEVWVQIIVALATLAVALWAILVARRQLNEAQRQREVQIGLQYLARYWEISAALLTTDKQTLDHKHHQHRYLLLCEDEFEAAGAGWLEDNMWKRWHDWLSSPIQRTLIQLDLAACPTPSEGNIRPPERLPRRTRPPRVGALSRTPEPELMRS